MTLPYFAIAFLLLVTIYSATVCFRKRNADDSPTWIYPNGTGRLERIFAGIGTLVIAAMLVSLAAWSHASDDKQENRPANFLIPKGYVGWVRVEFGVSRFPTLPLENEEYLCVVPPTGVLRTSSKMRHGSREDRYYYYSDGERQELLSNRQDGTGCIWGKISGAVSDSSGEKNEKEYEEFFVGTEQQFRQQMKSAPKSDPEKPPNR